MCAFIHLNTLTQFSVTLTEESSAKLSSHLLTFSGGVNSGRA